MNNCQDIFHALHSLIVKCRRKYIRGWKWYEDRGSEFFVWNKLDALYS